MHHITLFDYLVRATKKKAHPDEPDVFLPDDVWYTLKKLGYMEGFGEYGYKITFAGLWALHAYERVPEDISPYKIFKTEKEFKNAVKFWDAKSGRLKIF